MYGVVSQIKPNLLKELGYTLLGRRVGWLVVGKIINLHTLLLTKI